MHLGDRVEVVNIAGHDDLYGVLVNILFDGKDYVFPLCDLQAADEYSTTGSPEFLASRSQRCKVERPTPIWSATCLVDSRPVNAFLSTVSRNCRKYCTVRQGAGFFCRLYPASGCGCGSPWVKPEACRSKQENLVGAGAWRPTRAKTRGFGGCPPGCVVKMVDELCLSTLRAYMIRAFVDQSDEVTARNLSQFTKEQTQKALSLLPQD